MAADAAALLDQLMGANRNANPGDVPREKNWRDAEVHNRQYHLPSSISHSEGVSLQIR